MAVAKERFGLSRSAIYFVAQKIRAERGEEGSTDPDPGRGEPPSPSKSPEGRD
jgi:hypothetical protein